MVGLANELCRFFYITQPALEGHRRKIVNPSVSFGGYRRFPCIV